MARQLRVLCLVTPQLATLERLIRAQTQDAGAPVLSSRPVAELLARIRAAHPG